MKVAVRAPTGIETLAGKVMAFDVDASFTEMAPLPVPAGAFSMTVPVELEPPITIVGERLSPVIWNGLTDRIAV